MRKLTKPFIAASTDIRIAFGNSACDLARAALAQVKAS